MTNSATYTPDRQSRTTSILGVIGAGIGGALFVLVCWFAFRTVELPAFGPSNVISALSTLGSTLVILVCALLLYFWVRRPQMPRWRRILTYVVSYLSPAALVATTLTLPLSATRLYLDGVTVDQGFRTQYLTRLADQWQLSDMSYADLPPFYPGLWFWFGGRFANLLGMPGWEAFQPWSLVSIAAAASILVPIWQRITGSLAVATGIALTTLSVSLVTAADEPYALIITLGVPAAAVLACRALLGGNASLVAVAIYLGLSASMYTLYTAVVALSVIALSAVLLALYRGSFGPIIRLIIVGTGSLAIAAVVWTPYLLALLSGQHTSGATAQHYLPDDGAALPLPMLSFSLVGVLCMIGTVYLIARFRTPDVMGLGITLLLIYGWVLLSMAMSLAGTTLLGFRLDALAIAILATAGVLGIADIRLYGIHRLYPQQFSPRVSKIVTMVMVVVLSAGAIDYAQSIPNRLRHGLELAYSDTDGYGERADRYPADSGVYYQEISEIIARTHPVPGATIVLTDEDNFLAFHPYRGFQAFTSHYANPLGEFDERNQVIEQWADESWDELAKPQDFKTALESAKWRGPDAFIFRGDASDMEAGWKYDLAEDIFPNNPNVRFRGLRFNPAAFMDDSVWSVTQVGPFVVVTAT